MKLYVMRHGPAEDHAPSGADADRTLTAPGRERVRNVAKLLFDSNDEPAQVFTSPLVRTVQTAEIVAVVTKLSDRNGTVEVRRELAPGGDKVTLVRALASEGRRRVMLVGHEPDLSELISALLGDFGRSFDKAMVVSLSVRPDGGDPRLRFILDPKTLRLDPDLRSPR